MSNEIEFCLRRLRRHGALFLGSKAAADERIEQALSRLAATESLPASGLGDALFRAFHDLPAPTIAEPLLDDFAEADRSMVKALHKISMNDRALLLLQGTERFDEASTASILGLSIFEVAKWTSSARILLEASLQGRLCMIVEDDLIALRDLQAEVTEGGLSVGGAAKSLTEAFGLAEQIRPDIGIIDLALPEGALAGAEIAARLRQRFGSKILFVTAYDKAARDVALPEDSIIRKPWSRASLNRAISTVAA